MSSSKVKFEISLKEHNGANLDKKVYDLCVEFSWWLMTIFVAFNGFS